MKKTIAVIISIAIMATCVIALSACEDADNNGLSAYELAVKNGFEGTETEWLESLKGTDGEDGVDGTNGINGLNGTDGKDNTLTVNDYYEAAVEAGYEGEKLDFIKEVLGDATVVSDNKYTIAENLLSSVSIVCQFEIAYDNIFYGSGTTTTSSSGSGVIYKLDKSTGSAYIITNYHVVYAAESVSADKISRNINVYLYGGETGEQAIPATFIGGAMNYDVAVLYIENSEILKNSDAKAVEFADSNEIAVGQTAIAIGNAQGKGISATSGVISVDSENLTMTAADNVTSVTFRVMRVDCAVNKGNSGGGLFDSDGKLIGLVNAKIITEDVENIAYALPSNVVRYVVENILYYVENGGDGTVKKCMLGVTVIAADSKAVYNSETGTTAIEESVTVYEYYDEQSGEDSRIQEGALVYGALKNGDVIKSVGIDRGGDGTVDETHDITRSYMLVDLMLTMRVGDVLTINIERTENEAASDLSFDFTMTEECIQTVK